MLNLDTANDAKNFTEWTEAQKDKKVDLGTLGFHIPHAARDCLKYWL